MKKNLPLSYLAKFFTLLLIYSISRVVFYIFNHSILTDFNYWCFLEGIRFDASALVYINAPILILHLIQNYLQNKRLASFTNILFYIINIPFILLNNVDIIYYQFSMKRSSTEILDLLSISQDVFGVYINYLFDYWYITLLSAIQIYLLLKLKLKITFAKPFRVKDIVLSTFCFLILIGLSVLAARGGTQLKPIKTIHAGILSKSNCDDVVLNTPFMMLHSYNQKKLVQHQYFDELNKEVYSTTHHFKDSINFTYDNVVVLIMESYSKEYVGFYNNGEGYTPFLDSLMKESLVFTNAYANGIKSIEALPAIVSSTPTLMTDPFITSSYANNQFNSLASILNEKDYHTSFFHGGKRGTMGFYEYSIKAKFNNYFGKEEFNNDEEFDGAWGVYDEPFFQFFAEQLNNFDKPFFSTFFSLSSHPPYAIPKKHAEKFNDEKQEIYNSIRYADYSMQRFFEKAQEYEYFDNTLFVITADHTSPLKRKNKYKGKVGRYMIPLIIYTPDGSLKGKNNVICQQIDILPSVLDILSYDDKFFSFGKSVFSNESWAVSFLKNKYLFIHNEGFMVNEHENYLNYQDVFLKNKSDNHEINKQAKEKLQHIKQAYNFNLTNK